MERHCPSPLVPGVAPGLPARRPGRPVLGDVGHQRRDRRRPRRPRPRLDIAWHRMAIGAVVLLGGYRDGDAGGGEHLRRPGTRAVGAVGGALRARPPRPGDARRPRRRPGRSVPLVGISAAAPTGDDGGARRPARGRRGARLRGGHPGGSGRTGGRPGHARGLRRRRAAAHAGRAGGGPAVHDRSPRAPAVLLYPGCRAERPGGRAVLPGAADGQARGLDRHAAGAADRDRAGDGVPRRAAQPAALAGGLLVLAAVAGLYVRRLGADRPARTARWTASVDRSSSAPITPRADP